VPRTRCAGRLAGTARHIPRRESWINPASFLFCFFPIFDFLFFQFRFLDFFSQERVMQRKFGALFLMGVLTLLAIPVLTAAQNASLDDDLQKTFKPAKTGSDSTGTVVTEAGTVLSIKKGGIRAFPPDDMAVLPNTYQDGNMKAAPAKTMGKAGSKVAGLFGSHIPGASTVQGQDKGDNSRLLTVDTKVYVTKITSDPKNDKVHVNIIECDSCNKVEKPSSFKAQIDFQFPKGYLAGGADAGQLSDVIAQVLSPSSDSDANAQGGGDQQAQNQQQQGGGGGGQAQQQQQQQAAPQSIEKGQTEDQVIAAFGQPDKVVNLGSKKLLIYKDMKVTLVGGKVSDVQ
jgi:hypothetical protein